MNKWQDTFLKKLFGIRLESIKNTFGKEVKTIDDFFLLDEKLIKLFDYCEFKNEPEIKHLKHSHEKIFTQDFLEVTNYYYQHSIKSWKESGKNFKNLAQFLFTKKFLIPKSVMIGIFLYDEKISTEEFVSYFFNSFTCYPFWFSLHIPKSLLPYSLEIYSLLNKLYKHSFTQLQKRTFA